MRSMTCKQLGGACDLKFESNTFEEVAELSKKHGMEMFQKRDAAHLEAMNEMKTLMSKPDEMDQWFAARKKEFDALPENS